MGLNNNNAANYPVGVQLGASGTTSQGLGQNGALRNILTQTSGSGANADNAIAFANQFSPLAPKADPWEAAFQFFAEMGKLTSLPGSTALGGAVGSLLIPMNYLNAKKKERLDSEAARTQMALTVGAGLKDSTGKITYRPATPAELLKYGGKAAGQMGSDGKFYDLSPTSGGATKGQLFTFTSPEAAKTWLKANPTYELTEDQKNGTASILLPQSMGIIPANSSILTESLKPADPETVYKNFRTNYTKDAAYKMYNDLKANMDAVNTNYELAYELELPGVADMSMIFAYMKMLDPTSVVREGEQAQARGTGDAFTTAANLYNKLLKDGGSLQDAQRRSFRNAAFRLYEQKTIGLDDLNTRFGKEAEARDLVERFDLYKITPKVYDLKVFGEYPGDAEIDALTGSSGLTTLSIIAQYDNINTNQLAKINQRIAQIEIDLEL